jgi:mannobiose 2-epimerase
MDNQQMKKEARQLLEENILPFWMNRMEDVERGGFYGRMDGQGTLHADAPRGAVLNARILWAFAAAYRVLGKPEYLAAATRARDTLMAHFIDSEQGGVFWSVAADGRPLDTKKQTYAQGFAVYGLSEYARATGDDSSLRAARQIFKSIEGHCFDADNGGYHEALTRTWQPIADMRLSDKDENGDKTMNTHLHILEPYTNLYRVWPDARLRRQLLHLVDLFTDRLFNPVTHHLDLFFDARWQGKRNIESYGHDIEASWLISETADVLHDASLSERLLPFARAVAKASEEGLRADGSMVNERFKDTGRTIEDRDWWVQCECVIGELNLARLADTPEEAQLAMRRARRCFDFISQNLVDRQLGEWYWSIRADGKPNVEDDRAGFWKCPYHNTRMCLEILER